MRSLRQFFGFGFAILAAMLAFASPAQAQSANAKVNAKVLKPITLTAAGSVDLGTIVMPSTATYSGAFTVQAAATQTGTFCASGFTCTGTPAAASFTMTGSKNQDISVAIPLTVTMSQVGYTGGGATPTIAFTTSNSLAANNGTGTYTTQISGAGQTLTFYIGGTATITQATADGTYEGTVTVTASYL